MFIIYHFSNFLFRWGDRFNFSWTICWASHQTSSRLWLQLVRYANIKSCKCQKLGFVTFRIIFYKLKHGCLAGFICNSSRSTFSIPLHLYLCLEGIFYPWRLISFSYMLFGNKTELKPSFHICQKNSLF